MLCRTAGAACPLPLPEGTDMNPFAKTVAGLFLVVGPQTNNPLEAEGICSALIQKLSDDRSRNLEPSTWQNAVQMVPSQVESATTSQTLDRTMPIGDLPGALASICANVVGGSHTSALAQPIGSYLSKFGEPAAFNCLILDQTRTSQIHLYLTCLNVTDAPVRGVSGSLRPCFRRRWTFRTSKPGPTSQRSSAPLGRQATNPSTCASSPDLNANDH